MIIEPGLKTRELLVRYSGEFSDGTPRGWAVSRDSLGFKFTFPNGASIHSADLLDDAIWTKVPDVDHTTTILWRNSLIYLVRLLEFEYSEESVNITRKIVEGFLNWFEEIAVHDIQDLKSGSLDHQGALRIRTLLSTMSLLSRSDDSDNYDIFYNLFVRLMAVEEKLLNELNLYQPNNHGIMLGIAHLHASFLFPGSTQSLDAAGWVKRLYATLGDIIDADGIASENTPIYQVFYVSLIEDIVAFLIWSKQFPGKVRIFQLLMRAAQIGVQRQLLPNGAVPPLGDSPGGMQHKFKPLLGTLWSPSNGLAISSSTAHYLSFTAGFRSVIHKQLDELSVTWWSDGGFILRDAGLLSYDLKDPIAVAMRGHQGHSLPTYANFDRWTTQNSISFGRNDSRLRAKLLSNEVNSEFFSFEGLLKFDEKDILKRKVQYWPENKLEITDTFHSVQYGIPIVRFILDPTIIVLDARESSLTLKSPNREISMTVESNAKNVLPKIRLDNSFIAAEHYMPVKTKEVLISPAVPVENYQIVTTFQFV
ncbi:heparinase II/III family protein [Arthrobacter sp. AQ5-05]|uniref:heparinase II/III family protein n=1 Tax=Arthrobacter sp. AQ5-05 TaxID=2184581 RepID=UPI0015EC9A85|nr:heparinase II/III family protein [Arthrobacter sp. AQ5-05]